MSSTTRGGSAVDQARELLCQVLARMADSSAVAIRTRIVQSSGEPVEAWFYARSGNEWQKEPERITDPNLVRALSETLEMLASKEHGDEWSTRVHTSADHRDTEIQLHRDKLAGRSGKKLESALMGLLFRDGHDSKKDVRRSIRKRRGT